MQQNPCIKLVLELLPDASIHNREVDSERTCDYLLKHTNIPKSGSEASVNWTWVTSWKSERAEKPTWKLRKDRDGEAKVGFANMEDAGVHYRSPWNRPHSVLGKRTERVFIYSFFLFTFLQWGGEKILTEYVLCTLHASRYQGHTIRSTFSKTSLEFREQSKVQGATDYPAFVHTDKKNIAMRTFS